jgi:drug/metabolite transporter (DMT)-like permease
MVTGVLGQFDTILAIFMGYLIFKEKITKNAIIGITLTIIGLTSMTILNIFSLAEKTNSISQSGINWKNLFSITVIIIGLTGWSGFIFLAKKIEDKMSYVEITSWTSIFGAFCCLVISFLFENPKNLIIDLEKIDKGIILNIIYSGVFGLLIPNLLFLVLMKKYDVSKLNSFVLLAPVITIIGTIIFLDQDANPWIICSILSIVLGIFIANYKKKSDLENLESPS